MGKLIFQMMTSLDGFIEDEKASLDWHLVDDDFNAYANDLFRNTSVLLLGSRTYDLMYSYWPTPLAEHDDPEVARYMNELPKIVFSTTMDDVAWGNTRLIKENIAAEVQQLKERETKNLWLIGSSDIAVILSGQNLIDEYNIIISPIVLGDGKRLLQGLQERLKLTLRGTRFFTNGNVLLQYKPSTTIKN